MESNENNANPNASNANAEAKNEIHVEEEKKDEQVPQNSQLTQSKTFTQSTQLVKSPEDIIKAKVSKIRSNYNFAISYSNGIIAILKLFNNLLFEKVFNSLNENKNTLNFFKDISAFYMSFSDQIKKSNKIYSSQQQGPKIFDDGLKPMLENTQLALCKNFFDLSSSLKTKIMAKDQMAKVDEIYNAIELIRKEIAKRIDKLERRKKKLEKNYNNKYEALFNEFVPLPTAKKQKSNKPIVLEDTQDFVIIELDLSNAISKVFLKTNLYLTDLKDFVYKINMLVIEYSKLIREALMIYIQESKKMYNTEITKNFTQVEQYYETMSKPGADQSFKIDKIFHNAEIQKQMTDLLKQYQRLIVDSKMVKCDDLYMDNKFDICYYSNLELFFELLIQINPKPTPLSYSDLVYGVYAIKRDPGVFSSWRNCIMMFTKQKHVIVFDEPISKNFVSIFEMSHVTFRQKPDKKNNNLFEVVVVKKGKVMTSSGTYLYDAKSDNFLKEIGIKFLGGNEKVKAEEANNANNNNVQAPVENLQQVDPLKKTETV